MNFFFLSKFFLLTIFIQISSSFHWDGNILYDLETNTESEFAAEASQWFLSSYKTQGVKYSKCGNDYVLGGYNIMGGGGEVTDYPTGQYFERTYNSLPTHNQVYIQVQFYQIDTWDVDRGQPGGNDHFDLAIDGNSFYAWDLNYLYSGTYSICGGPATDFLFTFTLAYPHSASSLTFRMINNANEDSNNEALGFKNVQIEFFTTNSPYFSLCAPNVPSSYLSASRCSTSCTSSGNSITPAGYGFCLLPCSSNCKRCSDISTSCTSCQTGWFLANAGCYQTCNSPYSTKTLGGVTYCESPCPGQYIWWDNSCFPSCTYTTTYGTYTLVGKTVTSFPECTYQCGTNEYLYWNSSCLSSCPSPLIQTTYKGKNFCEYSCGSSDYLYWNGSCIASCPSPLIPEIQGTSQQKKFCWYPCAENEYVYWNGSCRSTCPSPLTPEIQGTSPKRNFCWYTCSESQFLYWNGSCLSTCPSPLISEAQGISPKRNFCWFPCAEGEYLYWNESCINSCPSPLTSEIQGTSLQRKFCWYTCSETQYLYWNGSCLSTCPSPLEAETQSSSQPRNFCWYLCQPSDYLYWNGSCLNACPSPLSPETQGIIQQRNFCWYPCSETQYLYWNESCKDTCPYPLAPETQGPFLQRNFCWYSCQSSEFLYWNGSCLNTCPSPLSPEIQGITQERNFCWYSCQPSEYLYWNESCISTCPYPLAPETQYSLSSSRNFCWFPCPETDFLFWNGSCINTCPSPLSPETQGITQQRNFCWYTCDVTEHLYWNQSCLNNCPIPLVSFDLSTNFFCFLPCDMPNIYWYQDFSCRPECNFPYNLVLHDSVSQCLKPCNRPSEYFYDLEKECHDTCDPPYVRQIINTIKVCHITRETLTSETHKIKSTADVITILGKITSGMIKVASIPQLSTPRSALLIQLSSMIQYIRYMRINYPWRVQLLFQSNGPELISLSFDFSIPDKIEDKFDNYPLPYVFERYDLDSNFINNMWDLLNTFLLVIFGILALLILRKVFKKSPKANHLTTRIIQSLRWNIPIAMISGGSGEIIFYASLFIRNTPLGSAISIVSFLISLLMIFWIIILLIICVKILQGFHLQKQRITSTPSSETPNWLHRWKGYEILYEEIEQKYLFSLAYMVIYVIRTILFFGIISNFYDHPLTQSILINVINLLIFIYLLTYKPLKDMWNSIQLFINEILGNILTICVLALAIMDRAEIESRYSRATIGNVIIAVMLTFYILGVVFLAIEGVLFLIKTYKIWKEMKARGIKNPFKIIQIWLFGEAEPHPEEIPLELSENTSRLETSSIQPQKISLQNLGKVHPVETKGKSPTIVSDLPLDSSSRFFLPIRRVNPTGIQITESEIQDTIQNTEFELETSHRRPQHNENLSKERAPEENTSGLMLSTSFEPSLQPNVDFIRNWGNLKARMKRFNQSIHKIHWSQEQ